MWYEIWVTHLSAYPNSTIVTENCFKYQLVRLKIDYMQGIVMNYEM